MSFLIQGGHLVHLTLAKLPDVPNDPRRDRYFGSGFAQRLAPTLGEDVALTVISHGRSRRTLLSPACGCSSNVVLVTLAGVPTIH
jgi:hypothetical protein